MSHKLVQIIIIIISCFGCVKKKVIMNGSINFGFQREMLFNSDTQNGSGNEKKYETFMIPFKNVMIALLDHPASITVYHYVSIEVISGSVSVNGYEIKKGSLPLKVFSSEKTGLVEVKTETIVRIWKKKEEAAIVEDKLFNIIDDRDKSKEILKNFGNSTVAIAVKLCVLPPNLQYLELYYPSVIDFNLFKKKNEVSKNILKDSLHVDKSMGTPVEFNLTAEKLASEISIFVRSAKLTETPAPRIVVCGPKNAGKSSLIRFLINKILSVYVIAYYLDADPGQPEFTPPGLVSLTKVNNPIVGPPFSHLEKPVSMIFTGGISADSSPDMYSKSVWQLMELYKKQFSSEPLFVNTMGWMEGLGLHCLQNLLSAVKPTVLVEIVNEDEISMFDYRDYLSKDGRYFQICRLFNFKQTNLSPKDMRNASLLSYFGQCLNQFEGPVYLNDVEPYCVSWDKLPIYLFGKKVPPYRMAEAINASIIALCKVPETAVLRCSLQEYPRTLEDESDNECLGYGLVRAIDETNHILYIITPLSLKELQEVNAIIKGNITVPDEVFLNQPLYNTPLPFTNEREIQIPVPDEEMANCSMLSLKFDSDFDSPTVNLTACGSADSYRRKIPNRHRRLANK